MFLKTESFEHNGVTVTLSELSALQRIEHLALMKRQAEQAESDSNRKFTVEDAIRTGAFLVAMSLYMAKSVNAMILLVVFYYTLFAPAAYYDGAQNIYLSVDKTEYPCYYVY